MGHAPVVMHEKSRRPRKPGARRGDAGKSRSGRGAEGTSAAGGQGARGGRARLAGGYRAAEAGHRPLAADGPGRPGGLRADGRRAARARPGAGPAGGHGRSDRGDRGRRRPVPGPAQAGGIGRRVRRGGRPDHRRRDPRPRLDRRGRARPAGGRFRRGQRDGQHGLGGRPAAAGVRVARPRAAGRAAPVVDRAVRIPPWRGLGHDPHHPGLDSVSPVGRAAQRGGGVPRAGRPAAVGRHRFLRRGPARADRRAQRRL